MKIQTILTVNPKISKGKSHIKISNNHNRIKPEQKLKRLNDFETLSILERNAENMSPEEYIKARQYLASLNY